jgi:hypothetical protein
VVVLARAVGGDLVELDERSESLLHNKQDLFVFTAKTWHARNVIRGASSSVEERRQAVVDCLSFDSVSS